MRTLLLIALLEKGSRKHRELHLHIGNKELKGGNGKIILYKRTMMVQIPKFKPNEYEKDKAHRKFSYNWLTYTYVQMSKSQDRPCNETRCILCAKFVDVHKVMVHAKCQKL